MKKRRILLAVLFICFALSLQDANATQGHLENQNLTNNEYTEYSDTNGGVLKVDEEHTNNVTESTLKNNKADKFGGAVYNDGTVNVKDSKFEENNADGGYNKQGSGGAIYNAGTLTVEGSSFLNNNAGKSEHVWLEEGHGGAIYNKKNTTITNSTFTGNHARYGGAIHNEKDASLTVQGTFTGNTAKTGGAINNYGDLTVKSGSTFDSNSATSYDGGAINNYDGTINIEDNVTFKNNNAYNNEDDYIYPKGGALHSEGDGNSKVSIGNGVTFEGNTAEEGGGIGLYKHNDFTIGENATFKNNKAQLDGGAINVYTLYDDARPSNFTIGDNALFEGNQAGFEDEAGYTPNVVFGGAISVSDGAYTSDNYSSFTIGDNAIFRNNKAGTDSSTVYGYGGALYNAAFKTTVGNNALFEGNTVTYAGGAISNYGGTLALGENAVFRNNVSNTLGGAIYNYVGTLTLGNNALFEGNMSTMGGAIYNSSTSENSIQKAVFKNNEANSGGAIYNDVYTYNGSSNASTLNIADSVFTGNKAKSDTSPNNGGAIYNHSNVKVTNSLFENNTADFMGGAIYNANNNSESDVTNLTVENSEFTKNSSVYGGAIAASDNNTTTKVTKTTFKNNYAIKNGGSGGQGGAIYSDDYYSNNTLDVEDSVFESNLAESEGGAIWVGGKTNITNSLFKDNKTTGVEYAQARSNSATGSEGGGAIFVGGTSTVDIKKSDFINNLSDTIGGAIATRSGSTGGSPTLTVSGSSFNGNTAKYNGGAIASYTNTTITDTNFVNNKAGNKGGAIWASGDVTINAKDSDIVFLGNSAEDGGDIYMDKSSQSSTMGDLTLKAEENKNITIADGISGLEEYDVKLDGKGTVTFNGEIKNAKMEVKEGTLHLAEGSYLGEGTTVNVESNATFDSQDGRINDYSEKVFMSSGSKLKFDISAANKTTDKFSKAEGFSSGTVNVEDFNFLPDTTVSSGNITSAEIKDSLGLGDEVDLELPEKTFKSLTPLRYVNVQSGTSGISYTPTGNTYNDFNPAVTTAPVAAQLGGYLAQLDSYDEAFRNMDMYMIMPKKMRQSMKYKNKYASSGSHWNLVFDKSQNQYDNTALWARPYATFENVRLKNGPKVSNVSWGTYLGGDSEMYELSNGWESMWSLYAGYNGSHQAYNGIGIYQNGGTIGLTGNMYKNNFFTGLTANVGANSAEASTLYGDDSFGLFRTGAASKTGYNIEFADGKFIIQPSWLMSYSFVNTENYTTSSGIRINSNPLNVLQLEPGIKFIGNTNNGWQPYTGLSIVWNLFDKTDFNASDATLPELSVKPFFKYGLGLRKLYGERFAGYGQTYFTSGGRNGVGLQFGGRWTI